MERQVHNLVQGTPEWDAFRACHDGASEAAPVMGLSKKATRTEILRLKALGLAKEFSEYVQKNILAKGHAVEALARPIIEELIGEDLYPATYSYGRLSASVDGINMAATLAMEHKQFEKELFASVKAGVLPEEHWPQTQQILLVTGAERLIFVVSDGTAENMAYLYVEPDEAYQQRIVAAWKQFNEDVANYVPETPVVQAVGAPIMALPALNVRIRGEVVVSNLPIYEEAALAFIAKIPTLLETDQDFANAAKTISYFEESEKDLEAVKKRALEETVAIDQLFKTIDVIKESMRAKRLELDKIVEARKVSIRGDVIRSGKDRLAMHIATLNARLGGNIMPTIDADFAGAIKGKRTVVSLHNAVDTELANKKIEASEIADRIEINQRVFRVLAADHTALFPDLNALLIKLADDFRNAVQQRIKEFNDQPIVVAPLAAPAEPPARGMFTSPVAEVTSPAAVFATSKPATTELPWHEQSHQSVLENIYLFASDRKYSDADARETILKIVTPFVVREKKAA